MRDDRISRRAGQALVRIIGASSAEDNQVYLMFRTTNRATPLATPPRAVTLSAIRSEWSSQWLAIVSNN